MPYHIRNILIAVLLVLLAIVAGVDAYISYQFKSNIDHAIESAKDFVQIKYKELSTSPLTGTVKLTDVRVSAPFLPEDFLLGDISLATPDLAFMFSGAGKIKKGELPNQLTFDIDQASFDLHGETADLLDNLVKRLQPLYAGTNARGESERKICGGKSIFGPSEYKELGYSRLISNLNLRYHFDENSQLLTINMRGETQNVAKFNLHFSLAGVSALSSDGMRGSNKTQLRDAQLTYEDKTYIPRIIKYCAGLDNSKKEDFINAEVKESDHYFYKLWGFAPGPGLREAYKDFLSRPDVVTLSLSPGKKLQAAAIANMTAEEIVEALKIKLKINGLLVTDLSFKIPPQSFTEKFEQQLSRDVNFEALLRGEKVKVPEPVKKPVVIKTPEPKYYTISPDEAERHLGDYVKITTLSGKQRDGRLIKIDDLYLFVQQKVNGGNFTMNVKRNDIKEMEAYFDK